MQQTLITNRTAVFGWVFMLVWLGFLSLFTGLLARDGSFENLSAFWSWTIIAVFWLFGFGFSFHLFRLPITSLRIQLHELVVRRRWLWKLQEQRFTRNDRPTLKFEETTDSEGDPYFKLSLSLNDQQLFVVSEGHHRASVEQAQATLAQKLRNL